MSPFWLSVAMAQGLPGAPDLLPPAEEPRKGEFHDDLAAAKALLFSGEAEAALEALERLAKRLDDGEKPPPPIAREALVYLGDARFGVGRIEDARAAFRRVLEDAPDHTISPYHHAEDVRALFALVREQVQRERELRERLKPVPPPPPPPPLPIRRKLPLWGYAPFGMPQFRQGRPGAGTTYATIQGMFAAASLGTYVWIVANNRDPEKHPGGWDQETIRTRVQTMRWGVQIPSTAAFYATWGLSVVDGASMWSREQRAAVQIGLHPRGVMVGGTF